MTPPSPTEAADMSPDDLATWIVDRIEGPTSSRQRAGLHDDIEAAIGYRDHARASAPTGPGQGGDVAGRITRARAKVPYSSDPLPGEYWRGYVKAIDEVLDILAAPSAPGAPGQAAETEGGDEVERAPAGTHVPGYGPYYRCPPCEAAFIYTLSAGRHDSTAPREWRRCPSCGDEWRTIADAPSPAPAEPESGAHGRCQQCGDVVRLVTESHLVGVDEDGDGPECDGSDSDQWERPHAVPAPAKPESDTAGGEWPEHPPGSLVERVRLVAADPDLSDWQRNVLADVRTVLRRREQAPAPDTGGTG